MMNLIKNWFYSIFSRNKNAYEDKETIRKIKLNKICEKLNCEKKYLISLLPDELKMKFKERSYISGGCIYSLYNDQTPKDIDFFIKSEQLAIQLRECFLGVSGYHGSGLSGGVYNGLPLIITDNAISIGKYQIITRWTGSPEEVLEQFDFKHNQFYYDDHQYGIGALVDFEQLESKELKYNDKRARDICGTIIRTSKFIQRGMTITSKEMAKMLLKLHEVGFNMRELEILQNSSSDKHFGS